MFDNCFREDKNTRLDNLEKKINVMEHEIDMLKLSAVYMSDLSVFFKDMADMELFEMSKKLSDCSSLTVKNRFSENGTKYHVICLTYFDNSIDLYSDYKLNCKYKDKVKSDIIRENIVLYFSTLIIKERLDSIIELDKKYKSYDYLTMKSKIDTLLERIGK